MDSVSPVGGIGQLGVGNDAASEPAIAGAVWRASAIATRIQDLADRAQTIADRLENGTVLQPSAPDHMAAEPESPYGNGLCDNFLRQHDRQENALIMLETSLGRIASIV